MELHEPAQGRIAWEVVPSGYEPHAVATVSAALTAILADMFALYIKTRNFDCHMSGSHFRDHHLLLDDQGEQIFATTDAIAKRVRRLGGATLRSIGHIARLQRVADDNAEFVAPQDMLAELAEDNGLLTARLREVYMLCDELGDVASAVLIEHWIDEAERRTWLLYEATR